MAPCSLAVTSCANLAENKSDDVGLPKLVARMQGLAAKYGARFKPAKTLVKLASSGGKFFPDRPAIPYDTNLRKAVKKQRPVKRARPGFAATAPSRSITNHRKRLPRRWMRKAGSTPET